MQTCKVVAVIVAYQPELPALVALLQAIGPQTAATVVIDNGSSGRAAAWLKKQAELGALALLAPGENLGVAAAHNRGIAWARQQQASHVLLLDQDSVPQADMVAHLLAQWSGLVAAGIRVAAVGPAHRDPRTGAMGPFVRLGWLKNHHFYCAAATGVVPVDFLISSGMLIPLAVLDQVGAMCEALFIDHVDTEWCFRAAARGFSLYGVCAALMLHALGDRMQRLWFFGRWRYFAVHGPQRLYYITRNRLVLYRLPHTPWRWIVQDLLRFGGKWVRFALFVPPRRQNAKLMWQGLRDGLAGRMGRYSR